MLVGKVITGKLFNMIFKGKRFYKLTNKDEIHNGFKFNTGLNVDTEQFNPVMFKSGGMYFCDYESIPMWYEYKDVFCTYYRKVIIPDDANVYVEDLAFKTDKFILGMRHEIWSDNEMCKFIVSENGLALEHVEKQTEEICNLAIANNKDALQYVRNKVVKHDIIKVRERLWSSHKAISIVAIIIIIKCLAFFYS
jgi:hypothetical protein